MCSVKLLLSTATPYILLLKLLCPDHRVPPKPTRRPSPVCKSKDPLFLYKFPNSDSLCVQRIGMIGDPRAQLELGFYNSKGRTERFVRFRTPEGQVSHGYQPVMVDQVASIISQQAAHIYLKAASLLSCELCHIFRFYFLKSRDRTVSQCLTW